MSEGPEQRREIPAIFNKWLHYELPKWEQEGLVTPDAAQKLRSAYPLQAPRDASATLMYAIYIIGAAFVGGGVISLVASHWETLPAAFKVALIVGVMLAVHAGGFYMWKVRQNYPKLGHALVLLGTLIFGANIGLMAQIFHIHSNFYNGIGAWAAGALAVAYAAMSTPNMFVAIVASFIWFSGWMSDHPDEFCYYPLLAAALFVPYVYVKRSLFTLILALLVLGISLLIAGSMAHEWFGFALTAVALASLCYSWGLLHQKPDAWDGFSAVPKLFGILALGLVSYLLSFADIAGELQNVHYYWRCSRHPDQLVLLIPAGIAAAVSVFFWVAVVGATIRNRPAGAAARPNYLLSAFKRSDIAVLLGTVLMAAAVVARSGIAAMIAANVVCIGLSAAFVWTAFQTGERRFFWSGLLLFALVAVSRFFEWDTGLFVKAIVLITIGVGILYGGVAFEKHARKLQAPKGQANE